MYELTPPVHSAYAAISYRMYRSYALLGTPPSGVFFECLHHSNVYVSLISQ